MNSLKWIKKSQKKINLSLFWLLVACSPAVKMVAVHPHVDTVYSTVTTVTSGTVHAQDDAVLSFGVMGRIQKVVVQVGDQVTPGTLLAELENADLKMVVHEAKSEWLRSKKLFAAGVSSSAALEAAQKNAVVAQANLDKTLIRAPFGGQITELNIHEGEYFQLGLNPTSQPPLRLIDQKSRIIKGDIDEVDLKKVQVGQMAKVKIISVTNKIYPAKVTKVIPFVSTDKDQDRTSKVELEILPEGGGKEQVIPVGSSADVEIMVESKDKALVIPSRCILGQHPDKYVYLLNEDQKLQKQAVQLGIGNYETTEISKGLTPEQWVVIPTENLDLKEGLKVQADKQEK